MELLRLIVFISVLLNVVSSVDIKITCQDGENEDSVRCDFSETGTYTLLNLNKMIRNIEMLSLIDSRMAKCIYHHM